MTLASSNQAITIFEKILIGDIPCNKVFENDHAFAFHDIAPQAPVHVLIIPKKKIINIASAGHEHLETLGHVLLAAAQVARLLGIEQSGYRLVFNNGADGGQSVDYLHCHLLAGRTLQWPPG
jgi:histidine triad (HIT) family protein